MLDVTVFVVTYLTMASQFAVAKLGYAAGLTPWDIVVIRYAGAALVVLPFLAWPSVRRALLGKPAAMLALAVLGGAPYGVLLAAGIEAAPTIHGAVIIPATTVILSFALSGALLGMPITRDRMLGAGVTVLGLVLFGVGAGATVTHASALGDLLFLGAGLFWALFTVLQRRLDLDPLAAIAAIGLGGGVTVPLFAALLPSGFSQAPAGIILLQAVFHGPLHTCLSFYLYGRIVRRLGAATAALGLASVPIIGVVLGIVLLGEFPPPLQWAGIAVVALGLVVASGALGRLLGGAPAAAAPAAQGRPGAVSAARKSSDASP